MVAGLVAALLAPVTGGLFGLAYGTAIRIGYVNHLLNVPQII